ncbi:hypothetical protein BGX28_009902 [Mortierella sp. GBA30]|nr:hypothetical protein BGX28_009902 [Mortierella sp. GBA30]
MDPEGSASGIMFEAYVLRAFREGGHIFELKDLETGQSARLEIPRNPEVTHFSTIFPVAAGTLCIPKTCNYTTFRELSLIARLDYNGSTCTVTQSGRDTLTNGSEGLTSRPETTANKCILESGHILAMSVSYIEGPAYNITDLKGVSSRTTDTLASLGQNFIVDNHIHIIYDTADIQVGFEVPGWLVVLVIVIMVTCACFWSLTLYFLDERFTISLYKLKALKIAPHAGHTAPMLMKAKVKPAEIEGFPVVAMEEKHEFKDYTPDSARSSFESLTR